MAVNQGVTIHKHGEVFYVGVDSFFSSHPGTTDSTIYELLESPTNEVLGDTVQRLLDRSGVLDYSLHAQGGGDRSQIATALGLPSDSVLSSETVVVGVTRRGGRLIVEPLETEGAGGGFGGNLEEEVLDDDAAAEVIGASVHSAADRAEEASAAVLRPAGSWRDEQTGGIPIAPSGVVTVRREPDGWVATARIGARGLQTAAPSTSVIHAALDSTPADLGRLVAETLAHANRGDLQPGDEDPVGGERQLLVEAEEEGLMIYPQAINPDTGAWDISDRDAVRHVPRQASMADLGRAVHLAADEQPEW